MQNVKSEEWHQQDGRVGNPEISFLPQTHWFSNSSWKDSLCEKSESNWKALMHRHQHGESRKKWKIKKRCSKKGKR